MKDGLSIILGEGTVKGRIEQADFDTVLYLILKDYTKYPVKRQDIMKENILKALGRMCYEKSYMHVERSKLYVCSLFQGLSPNENS